MSIGPGARTNIELCGLPSPDRPAFCQDVQMLEFTKGGRPGDAALDTDRTTYVGCGPNQHRLCGLPNLDRRAACQDVQMVEFTKGERPGDVALDADRIT
jgi:hypothetical protein